MAHSRIKRRNRQGFTGTGSYSFQKMTDYGDYRIEREIYSGTDPEKTHLINRAKKYGDKHPGSKTLRQLRHLYA